MMGRDAHVAAEQLDLNSHYGLADPDNSKDSRKDERLLFLDGAH